MVQLAAALSPLQAHASGQQAAVLAQVAAATTAELSAGFVAPLAQEQAAEQQQQQRQASLAKLSLNLASGVQLAYASSGGLHQWRNPRTGAAIPPVPSGDSGTPSSLYVGLGSLVLAAALTPDTAAADSDARRTDTSRSPAGRVCQHACTRRRGGCCGHGQDQQRR